MINPSRSLLLVIALLASSYQFAAAQTVVAESGKCVTTPVTVARESCVTLQPHTGPRVALALGGGGTRGAAHIGVLKVLKREGIPIEAISGCSIGAIVGGLYSSGMPLEVIENKLRRKEIQKAYAPIWVRNGALRILPAAYAYFMGEPGLTSPVRLTRYLERQAPLAQIENLKPRFCTVTTELLSGDPVYMTAGPLSSGIAASSALPPVLKPFRTQVGDLVDGGLAANLPAIGARKLGADVVIAVSVNQTLKPVTHKKVRNIQGITDRMTVIAASQIDIHHSENADLTILPDCSEIGILSRKKKDVDRAIRAGEVAAEAALPKIRELLQKKDAEIRSALIHAAPTTKQIGTVGPIVTPQ